MIIKTVSKRQPSVCFHCRRDFEIRTYPVINACETPEIALELIEERHFTDICPHCGIFPQQGQTCSVGDVER